jgi:DNA gyrase/topoisomerase IV subunit A
VVDKPEITVDELMEFVKGPDFPTGGILCGTYGVADGLPHRPRRRHRARQGELRGVRQGQQPPAS